MKLPGFSVAVERDEVSSFARAIGENRGEYHDIEAAHALRLPDLATPPTFLFALEFRRPQPYLALELLGAPVSAILHAEQGFDHQHPTYAGDRLDFFPQVDDYYEKAAGRLGFLRRRTDIVRDGQTVARLSNLVAIRWDRVA